MRHGRRHRIASFLYPVTFVPIHELDAVGISALVNQPQGGSTPSTPIAYSMRSKRRPKSKPFGTRRIKIILRKVLHVESNAALRERLREDVCHLPALGGGGGVVIKQKRRACRNIFDRDRDERRGGVAIGILPACLFQKRNANGRVKWNGFNVGVIHRMLNGKIGGRHGGASQQNIIHNRLTIKTVGNALTGVRVGKNILAVFLIDRDHSRHRTRLALCQAQAIRWSCRA